MGYPFPPGLAEKVRQKMESGRYGSEDELLRDALRALDDEGQFRAEIEERIRESETDEGEPLDVQAAILRLEARISK